MTFSRLTAVELRKMVDTRAGFWLQLAVWLLTPAAVALYAIFGHASEHTFQDFLSVSLAPLTDHPLSGLEWAHAGTALALWLAVPLAVGLARITRSDVA
jgi:hypothetical protein